MRIEKYPLTDSYYIIVFEGRKNVRYSCPKGSTWVIEDCIGISTDFSNSKLDLINYQMFGRVLDKNESDFDRLFSEANYIKEGNSKENLISFLKKQNFEVTENTYMLCPIFTKKLTGKKIPIEFNLGNPNFDYGEEEFKELDVYMTPITSKTKTVNFSVMIPNHIYQKCILDPNENLRPKHKYIESESLSYLHSSIRNLVDQAFNLRQREKDAEKAKKVICINFNSSESKERDSYNFGYIGQKISTSFNFYVCYFTGKEYYTYHKVDSGFGVTSTGVKGILDNTISGHKSWINKSPQVMIDWTQEREDFLSKLENNFRELSLNLNKFLKDLDSDKLDLLVANKELLKLS